MKGKSKWPYKTAGVLLAVVLMMNITACVQDKSENNSPAQTSVVSSRGVDVNCEPNEVDLLIDSLIELGDLAANLESVSEIDLRSPED